MEEFSLPFDSNLYLSLWSLHCPVFPKTLCLAGWFIDQLVGHGWQAPLQNEIRVDLLAVASAAGQTKGIDKISTFGEEVPVWDFFIFRVCSSVCCASYQVQRWGGAVVVRWPIIIWWGFFSNSHSISSYLPGSVRIRLNKSGPVLLKGPLSSGTERQTS